MAESEIPAREMPHSLEAEQAVLGAMLIDATCIGDVMERLRPDDFYIQQNQDIFNVIHGMFTYAKPVDALTVADELQKRGRFDPRTTRDYLLQLMALTPTSANVMEYVGILREKSLLRMLAKAAEEIARMVQEGRGEADAILEAAEQKIFAVRRGHATQDLIPVGQLIKPFLDRLNDLATGKSEFSGHESGFSAIDMKIHGLNPSDLILLAARPGVGKSSFALNVALHVAKSSQKTVAIFSLEMSKEQLLTRLLAAEGPVALAKLMTGRLNTGDWSNLTQAARTLRKMDIRIDDNPMLTVADMNAKCRRLPNLALVIVDYLQLMTSAGGQRYAGENRQQAVSDISRMLKIMAKELDVPVICLSQLSRANEKREDKRPMLSDLRDSGAIEQDADVVLFLYREDYYNEGTENRNLAECNVAKNRHGETGKIPLRWTPEYTTFSTIEMRFEEDG